MESGVELLCLKGVWVVLWETRDTEFFFFQSLFFLIAG